MTKSFAHVQCMIGNISERMKRPNPIQCHAREERDPFHFWLYPVILAKSSSLISRGKSGKRTRPRVRLPSSSSPFADLFGSDS